MTLTAARPWRTADKPTEAPASVRLAEAPEEIYSDNASDSWNRIFYYLFSRRLTARISSEFPEATPFEKLSDFDFMHLEKSTRTFERNEIGDRAIDPLYPSFLSDQGIGVVLKNPAYADFKRALQDGLADSAPRDAIAQAVMQSDLWSAYDIIFRYQHYEQQGKRELARHRLEALDLLGRLIRKVALTPEEIRTLPDDYAVAKTKYALPDLFGKTGWVEIKWFPDRLHDASADYRRVTRVFLKPARSPKDMQKFLNDFRGGSNPANRLDGVALIIQPLLVDTLGEVEPAKIVTDVQFRMFQKQTRPGAGEKTQIGVYEVNRRLLREAGSGLLALEGEDTATYLPAAGNDYSFASPNAMRGDAPLVVKQRTRCTMCHGDDLTGLMTFAMKLPNKEGPPVRQLNRAGHEAADFVVSKKLKSENWKKLQKYFKK